MIEIRITSEATLSLLLDRMRFELHQRQRCGFLRKGLRLEDLSYKELYSIVESSIFDTVFLMPMELITHQTNLLSIITDTVKSLSRIFHKEQFLLFKLNHAEKLIEPIIIYLSQHAGNEEFTNN